MSPTLRRPRVTLALVLLTLLCATTLYTPGTFADTLSPDGLLSKLDKSDRVTLTSADGTTREITVAEMDLLAKQQHAQQMKLQREKSDVAAAAAGEDDEAAANAPKRHTESMEAIQKTNPRFAANIELSKRAFEEIQRHGYARGYAFAGFSEKDDVKSATKNKNNKKKSTKREDYKVTLLLRATRDPGDCAAKTGTSAQKRASEPLTVVYEAQLLLDAQGM